MQEVLSDCVSIVHECFISPVDDLASPDHQEAAVPDVGGVQLEVGVGEHHQARRARADHLRLALLHLTETLEGEKYDLQDEII